MGDTNGTQLSSLKVRIKTWEKEFSGRCGRAPTKADISADPHIRDHYKKYWKCVKKSNMNEIWSHRLDKRHAKTSQPIAARNDVLDSLSKKMLDKYMKASTIAGDTGTADESFSFKKRLLKQRQQSADNQRNADRNSTRVDQSVVRHRQSMASGVDKSRQSVANDVDGSVSEPQSSDSLDINDLEIGLRNTGIKRKSDVFDFEDEFNDNIPDKPVKKRIYADLDAENKRVDPSMPSIDENEDNNQLSGDSTKKKKFFVSKDRNQRLNSLNPYKHTITSIIGIDDSMDTGDRPVKMVSNKKKSVESNGSNDSNVENKAKSPKETSKAAAPKKLRKKKPETNYKRLNIKRKVFCSRVISPLISLMEDQLISVPKCLKAVCIHSGMSPTQRQTALNSLLTGESQVLLLSPEAITGGNTCVNLNSLPPIGFVCIDEAHCLSEWSNNFRPSYLQLYRVLRDKLKVRTFLALTATATKKTALTIARTLGLDPQEDIIGTTLVPDNLVLTVSRDSNKELALIDLLKSNRFNGLKSIIIYCTRREQTERLASLIRISFQEVRQTNPKTGKSRIVWDAQAYHAGMTSEDRNRVQKRFIRGDLRVIVATIAFGMGINKADIRAIIHYNLPKSFENYMQEIGRAGRDGLEAHCHLFLDSDGSDLFELQRHIYANSTDRKCLRKLIEKVFKSCKCRSIMDLESDESVANSENVCAGHEIAFPIEATVMEMDLKEETISTLITYLELDFCRDKVKLLSPINSMCTLVCYGNGSEQMKAICKECPIVAIAVTLYQKNNASQEVPSKLKFDLVEVCSMLGRPISAVRSELRQLEWQVEPNGRKKRTHARVMFSDLSFYLKSVGDMTDEQLNECLEFLHDFTQIQESTEVSKLRSVYLTFKQYSQTLCTNRVNQTKSLELKNQLNKYFNDDDNTDDFLSTEFSDEKFAKHLKGTGVHDLEDARRNVREN
ncbi:unnamed protein product [Oppiella nova]|uniref:DNA 3'-5' helicase n=1 Tax=Oppiella nova TaxID=334625 RepID=A0A7R9MA82_9ACAR|nr:unnamed protein product [Oppiella nova]CAG2173678.1 unnamed protein product [Oppiella nova]